MSSSRKSPRKNPPPTPAKPGTQFFTCTIALQGLLAEPLTHRPDAVPLMIGSLWSPQASDAADQDELQLILDCILNVKQQIRTHLDKCAKTRPGLHEQIADRKLVIELKTGLTRTPFLGILSTPYCATLKALWSKLSPTSCLEALVWQADDPTAPGKVSALSLDESRQPHHNLEIVSRRKQSNSVVNASRFASVSTDAQANACRREIEGWLRSAFGYPEGAQLDLKFRRPTAPHLASLATKLGKSRPSRLFKLALAEAIADDQPLVIDHWCSSTSTPLDRSNWDIASMKESIEQLVDHRVSEYLETALGKSHIHSITKSTDPSEEGEDNRRRGASSSECGPDKPSEQHEPVDKECAGFFMHALCDHCDCEIFDVRFKCLTCADFDLCAKCESLPAVGHDDRHSFAKIKPRTSLAHMKQPSSLPEPQWREPTSRHEVTKSLHLVNQVAPFTGATLAQGSQFSQSWSVTNPTANIWKPYKLCHIGGTSFGSSCRLLNANQSIRSGETAVIELPDLTATTVGSIVGFFDLRDSSDRSFGVLLTIKLRITPQDFCEGEGSMSLTAARFGEGPHHFVTPTTLSEDERPLDGVRTPCSAVTPRSPSLQSPSLQSASIADDDDDEFVVID